MRGSFDGVVSVKVGHCATRLLTIHEDGHTNQWLILLVSHLSLDRDRTLCPCHDIGQKPNANS